LNKQFAVTIAVSVIISAFNALTLSPALSALMLRPRKEARGPLAGFFGAFNRWFAKPRRLCQPEPRTNPEAVIAVLILGGFALVDGFLGNRLPTSFLPKRTTVSFFSTFSCHRRLRLSARTRFSRKVETILKKRTAWQFVTSINGFSLLNRVSASYNGFCFISLQPWSERKHTAQEILKSVNARLASEVPEAMAFAFSPPAIPAWETLEDFHSGFRIEVADLSSCSIRTCKSFSRQPGNARSLPASALSSPRARRRFTPTLIGTRCSSRELLWPMCIRQCKPTRRSLLKSVQPLRQTMARLPAGGGRGAPQ